MTSKYWGMGTLDKGQYHFGKMLMKLRQYGHLPESRSLPTAIQHLTEQLEEIGFQVHALPGGSIGGRRKIGLFIQEHKASVKPVILDMWGNKDLQFIKQHPECLHSCVSCQNIFAKAQKS